MPTCLQIVRRLPALPAGQTPWGQLALDAHERTQTRRRLFWAEHNCSVVLDLPRGTALQPLDMLQASDETVIQIVAKPEPVLTVTAADPHQLLRAAYHLGNRHAPLEVQPDYLRLGYDAVLEKMLQQFPVSLCRETAPFVPERGAYHHHA